MTKNITKKSSLSVSNLFAAIIALLLLSFPAGAQELVWAKQMHGGPNDNVSEEFGQNLARDNEGNIYTTGVYSSTVDFDPGPGIDTLQAEERDAFIAKYDADGNYIWARRFGGIGTDWGQDVAVDASGNVYMLGAFTNTVYFETVSGVDSLVAVGGSTSDKFIVKYSGSGDVVWAKGLLMSGSIGNFDCGIAMGKQGDIYITGLFGGSIDLDPTGPDGTLTALGTINAFVAKYDTAGNYIWGKGILGTGTFQGQSDAGIDITVDTSGAEDKLCISGDFSDGSLDFDPETGVAALTSGSNISSFIAKYDTGGNYIWAKQIASDAYMITSSIAVDALGNVFISGGLVGSADFDPGPGTALLSASGIEDMFLAKYDSDGNYIWAKASQGAGGVCQSFGLALDKNGMAYVTGGFVFGAVDFDPGENVTILSPMGMADIFVAKYGSCGNLLSVVNMGDSSGIGLSWGYAILPLQDGNAYVTGSIGGTVDFDPGPDTFMLSTAEYGGRDIFLAKLHYALDSALTTYIDTTVCRDSFMLNNEIYTGSGTYQQWLPGTVHCDSFIVLHLTMGEMDAPIITVNGFVLGLTDSYISYQWLKDGAPIAGATSATYTVSENGNYQAVVADGEICIDTSAVYTVTNATGINNVSGARPVNIYPNPTNGDININSPVAVNAVLYSVDGREVIKEDKVKVISLKGLANGIYVLRLSDKDGNVVLYEKVAKQ